MLYRCSSYLQKTTNTPTFNGGGRGGVRIVLFSDVTLFEYNVSAILSAIVGPRSKNSPFPSMRLMTSQLIPPPSSASSILIISQSIDLAGLAHRERSLTLQCFLTWNSVQSEKIYPSYLFYFRLKKRAASHPQLGLAQHFFPQGHKLLRLKRDWKAVQYRKWSPTVNDPEFANDPQNGPQMILDRKWSPKSTANDPERKIGMTWTQVSGSSCRFYHYYSKSG